MTGGILKKVVPAVIPKAPDPTPTPIITEEVGGAKKKVRGRKRGRGENILAGRMMQGRQILNTGQLKLGV